MSAPAASKAFDPTAIWADFQKLTSENPRLRARDAAAQMDVSEEMLVASRPDATMLRPEFKELLAEIPSFGPVMALTRNEGCVHEKRGTYPAPEFSRFGGIFHSRDIDLRFFWASWHSAFAIREEREGGHRRTLQFFDHAGDALHKVWLEEESHAEAFDSMVERFASTETFRPSEEAMPNPEVLPEEEIDKEAFLQGWRELKDTHDFYLLLRKYKVHRLKALHLAEERLAQRLTPEVASAALEGAAKDEVPIMVFTGNPGMIQIHSGPVEQVKPLGPWMNVLDKRFNLHMRTDHIVEAWRVTKPTEDGDVNAIECYDSKGEMVVQFFGERKPGIPEAKSWRALLGKLEEAHRA